VIRRTVDRDLLLLHALEQCRLSFRRCPVDLIAENDVREDGARSEFELVGELIEDAHARHVTGE